MLIFVLIVVTAAICASAEVRKAGTVPPGAPLSELDRQRSIPPGFKEVRGERRKSPIEPTPAEKARGYFLFRRAEPGKIYPDSVPVREEITHRIAVQVTPGEVADFHFALHALRELEVRVEVERFARAAETGWEPDVRHVHCWPQRTDWSSRTYRVIPELLVKRDSVSLKAGDTQQYYLTVEVPEDAEPGVYRSAVRVLTGQEQSTPLTLELNVLPFSLETPPDMVFGLYPDTGAWPKSQAVRNLIMRKIRRQGFTMTLIYPLSQDEWTYEDARVSSSLVNTIGLMEAYKKAGLGGPFIMSVQGFDGMLRKMGVPGPCGERGAFSEEAADAMRQVIRILKAAAVKHKWPEFIPHGVDEPRGGAKIARTIWLGKLVRAEGLDFYCTIWNPGPMDPQINVRCVNMIDYGVFRSPGHAAGGRQAAKKAGDRFWCYGTGCYVNGGVKQDGNIISNRYMGGTFLWRIGVSGSLTWTLMRVREDPYFDMDGKRREPKEQCTVYPPVAPDVGFTPTLQWEGLRKGIDDYKYIYTLSQYIKRAKGSADPDKVARATQIEKDFDKLIGEMPWRHLDKPGQYPDNGKITNARLDRNRERIVEWLLELVQPGESPVKWHRGVGNCLQQPAEFYGTREAVRIAENVLLCQSSNGGWPKDYDRAGRFSNADKRRLRQAKNRDDTTIDNGTTHSEVRYLARVYQATKEERFKTACLKGIAYMLEAQYPNGGWPQFYPRARGYSRHITFNDGAMVGVLRALREIRDDRALYAFVDDKTRAKVAAAVQKGIQCILKCQIIVKGKKTAWCAQHDEKTFVPRKARSYELPSISGAESVGVVRFLMGIEKPTPDIIDSIQGALAWFQEAKLEGIRLVATEVPGKPKGKDLVVINDASAPPIWARFYQIGTNKPIFCSRDGIPRDTIAEISYERRNGYSWLGPYASSLLATDYPAWQKKYAPEKNVLEAE
ncbi:MAG: pectate lyase [Planctomycetota bacterium]|jgi:PelA/Pel-15E family pectate lyase